MKVTRSVLIPGIFMIINAVVPAPAAAPIDTLNVITSWVGNTFGTPQAHIMHSLDYMYVRPDGMIAAVTGWEEGGHNVSVFKDGKTVCIPVESGTGSWGRMSELAVTMDSQYIYQAMSQHGNDGGDYPTLNKNGLYKFPPRGDVQWQCVRRFAMDGSGASFAQGYGYDGSYLIINDSGPGMAGLCVDKGELFVADPFKTGTIKVYNTAALNRTPARSWSMARPGQLALDAAGYIWMLRVRDGVNAPEIIRFSKTGALQTQRITFADSIEPRCFGIDVKGNRILVSNDGRAQNVLIYANITTTPVLQSTFGTTGGINSGTPGAIAPLKFSGPTGVGCDSMGNIHVASNATGVRLERYTSQGVLKSQLLGLEFVDNAALDPTSEKDVYTKEEHFTVDYTKKTPGTEWSYTGTTLNRFKYPNDPRNHTSTDAAWIKIIGGKKFLVLTDMYTSFLQFYRFSPATDGETAIPCAMISGGFNGTWPPFHPAGNNWLWVDKNGNGDFDNGEYDITNDYPYIGGWWVDSIGNIWKLVRRSAPDIAVIKYPFLGLTAAGVPQYSNATKVTRAAPAIFTDPHKLEYDASNDRMYITGFTTALPSPKDEARTLGTEIARYDSWSTGTPVLRWKIPALLYNTALPLSADNMPDDVAMSVCEEYVFVAGCRNRHVKVYSIENGALVGTIYPGESIGRNYGWVDIPYGIRAFKRNSDEYTVFVEDDGYAKVIMYRWCPSGNCVEPGVSARAAIPHSAIASPSLRMAGGVLSVGGLGSWRGEVSVTDLHGRVVARTRVIKDGGVRISVGTVSPSTLIVRTGNRTLKQVLRVR